MTIEIRRLFSGDDAVVMRVAANVFDNRWPDRLAAHLASPGHFMIVALADGIVVAGDAAEPACYLSGRRSLPLGETRIRRSPHGCCRNLAIT